jgi:hypothetical protein
VTDRTGLERAVAGFGAQLVLERVAHSDGTPRHDPRRLAAAYERIFARGRIGSCP